MIVYLITNLMTGDKYVGQTGKSLNKRWLEHLRNAKFGKKSRFYDALRKYGSDHFSVETLSVAATSDDLTFLERYFIALHKSNDPRFGYNMSVGGGGGPHMRGRHLSEEHKKNLSIAHRGHRIPEEQRRKMSESHMGHSVSEETRRKIGSKMLGNNRNPYGRKGKPICR